MSERASPTTRADTRGVADGDRVVAAARAVVLALGAATFALFAYVVVCRFVYPIDGEWMVGGVRDAVTRLVRGKSMYVAPDERFIPFVYPPLYHWTCALLARFLSVFVACKVVSLASTGILAWCVWVVARRLGATRFWALAGVLLHFGAYSMTLMFYDLERVDAFAAAVVALALVALVTGKDRGRTVAAGVLLGLAFFAKQPHALALVASVAALLLSGERRRALAVGLVGAATFAIVFGYLEGTTHGWFRYYCVKIPGAHGIEPKVISTFFIVDWPRGFAIAAASLAMAVPLASSLVYKRRVPDAWSPEEVLTAMLVGTTMAEAFFLRAHRGGWSNVIIAWTPFGCMAASVVASRIEARAATTPMARAARLLLLAGVGFQLLGGIFDPGDAAPNADDLAERRRLIAAVRAMEQGGEVVVTTTGDITSPTHYQAAALYDILRAGDPLPADIEASLRSRKYAALYVGGPLELQCDRHESCERAFATLVLNYFVAARRPDREHTGMSGFDARPRWIMRPRARSLPPMSKEALERRVLAEMGLAEARARRLPPDTEPTIDDTIEGLATEY